MVVGCGRGAGSGAGALRAQMEARSHLPSRSHFDFRCRNRRGSPERKLHAPSASLCLSVRARRAEGCRLPRKSSRSRGVQREAQGADRETDRAEAIPPESSIAFRLSAFQRARHPSAPAANSFCLALRPFCASLTRRQMPPASEVPFGDEVRRKQHGACIVTQARTELRGAARSHLPWQYHYISNGQ